MLDPDFVRQWQGDAVRRYTERDAMLYALGLGIGGEPLDPAQLQFVYERGLVVLPTMMSVLVEPWHPWHDAHSGIDPAHVIHGEERLQLGASLPTSGAVRVRSRVTSLLDKGAGAAATATVTHTLLDPATQRVIGAVTNVMVLRGEGRGGAGWGVASMPLPPLPARVADHVVQLLTLPQAALLHRLCGDRNPLHADPAVARAEGFARPPLHGLCTLGITGYALTRMYCESDPARLREIAARFTAPVYPGDTIRLETWRDAGDVLRFRGSVDARRAVVLDRGSARVGQAAA